MVAQVVKERSPGEILGARYRLEALIGEGGMGQVWRAVHTVTRRRVALKLLKASSDPSAKRRMVREAQAAALIDHSAVVPVHDVLELDDGTSVLVMELLAGRTLRDVLAAEGKLSAAQACAVLHPVAEALAGASAAGIVHRDIKPENIFLVEDAGVTTVRVLDFGIAKMLGQEEVAGLTTREGTVMGTPFYMAPEQAFLDHPISSATDVWALGVVLYEAIAGQRPFGGETYPQLIRQLLEAQPAPLARVAPECPAELAAMVDAMLCREPLARPGFEAILDSLRRTRAGQPISLRAAEAPDVAHAATESAGSGSQPATGHAATLPAQHPAAGRRRALRRRAGPALAFGALALAIAGVTGSRACTRGWVTDETTPTAPLPTSSNEPPTEEASRRVPRVTWTPYKRAPRTSLTAPLGATDARTIVFVEADAVVEETLESGERRRLCDARGGSAVAGFRETSVDLLRPGVGVFRVKLSTGSEETLYSGDVVDAVTSPDGATLAVTTADAVIVVTPEGARTVASGSPATQTVFDPSGKQLAVLSARDLKWTLTVVSLTGATSAVIARDRETVRGGAPLLVWPVAGWLFATEGVGLLPRLLAFPVGERGPRGEPIEVENEPRRGLRALSASGGTAVVEAFAVRFEVREGPLGSAEASLESRVLTEDCDEGPSSWTSRGDLLVTQLCGAEASTWRFPGGSARNAERLFAGSNAVETPRNGTTFWVRRGADYALMTSGQATPIAALPADLDERFPAPRFAGPACGGSRCVVHRTEAALGGGYFEIVNDEGVATLRATSKIAAPLPQRTKGWALGADGETIALVDSKSEVALYRRGGRKVLTLESPGTVQQVAPRPGGGWIATMLTPAGTRLITADEHSQHVIYDAPRAWLALPTVSPDGKRLAVMAQPHETELWRMTVTE